jgi:hypothetical protein
LAEDVEKRVKKVFRPSGEGKKLNIILLDSSLLYEKQIADDLPFANWGMGIRDRQFKCTALLLLKTEGKSERKLFEEFETKSFQDIADYGAFASGCHDRLVVRIGTFLKGWSNSGSL